MAVSLVADGREQLSLRKMVTVIHCQFSLSWSIPISKLNRSSLAFGNMGPYFVAIMALMSLCAA
jgi:hypothetical protein